jgi:catechol 2,3-dioxygenase-like lactoylglutathione lyase family enzyme
MKTELLTGIQHIGIPTENIAATREFYEKLGFEVAFQTVNEGAEVIFFKLNDLVLETYEVPKAAKAYGAIEHVAINVTDVEAVYDEICSMGMNTLQDTIHFLPYWENGVRFFTIEGPNAEKIEFSQFL